MQVRTAGGTITLTEGTVELVSDGVGISKAQKRAGHQHIPLVDIAVVEAELGNDRTFGWVRFGREPLHPGAKPSGQLADWMPFDPTSGHYGELRDLIAAVAGQRGIPDPFAELVVADTADSRPEVAHRDRNTAARAAFARGDRFFQLTMTLRSQDRDSRSRTYGTVSTETSVDRSHPEALAAVEDEGWGRCGLRVR